MVLKYQLSPYPTLLEDMTLKIWEAGNDLPGQEVYTQAIPQDGGGGHTTIKTITVNGLDLVVHKVRLYSDVTNQLLHDYNAEPRVDTVTVFSPIRFKIGDGGANTPAANSNVYQNDLLKNLTNDGFVVIRNNVGAMHPITHYGYDPTPGTFTLIGLDTFGNTEEFTILIQPTTITSVVNDSVTGKWVGGFVDIAAPLVYIAGHLRKLLRFTNTTSYTFNVAPPIGYGLIFQNFGPVANQIGTINFTVAPLLWGNTTKATIALPLYSEACFVFDGTNFNVVYISDTKFINGSSTPTPGQILGVGTITISNIPFGVDNNYEITHGLAIAGDYLVFTSKRTTLALAGADDNLQTAWFHHATLKPNRFWLTVGNPNNQANNVTICWQIIKI